MNRAMRRSDREVSREAALAILDAGEYGVLSSVDESAQPYGVPVSFALLDDTIVFHSATEGHKLENFIHNPKVSFCVVGKTKLLPEEFSTRYESAIVFGRVDELVGERKVRALQALVIKYSPGFEAQGESYIHSALGQTAVYAIHMDQITGKARE